MSSLGTEAYKKITLLTKYVRPVSVECIAHIQRLYRTQTAQTSAAPHGSSTNSDHFQIEQNPI
jgi:hypothetical protein